MSDCACGAPDAGAICPRGAKAVQGQLPGILQNFALPFRHGQQAAHPLRPPAGAQVEPQWDQPAASASERATRASSRSCGALMSGSPSYGDARRWYDLLEQLQVLSAQLGKIEKHSSDIASRPRDARYQSRLNRIDFEVYPCDRDRACCVLAAAKAQVPRAIPRVQMRAWKKVRVGREQNDVRIRCSVPPCNRPRVALARMRSSWLVAAEEYRLEQQWRGD